MLPAFFKLRRQFVSFASYLFTKEQLDKHMDSFVTKEGFKTVEQCFEAIDRFDHDAVTR